MLKSLYSRLILWLIRPALERREAQRAIVQDQINHIVVNDISRSGPVSQSLERTYGLQRVGR